MSEVTREQIDTILQGINERYLEKDIVAANLVKDVDIKGDTVFVRLEQNYPAGNYRDELEEEVQAKLEADAGIAKAEVTVEQKVAAHSVQKSLKRIEGIKNIIAVASGKGGVGKSTTSLMAHLWECLDADIYGPSQPRMLGISGQPQSEDGKTLEPMENYDIKAMSIGFLVEEDTPMIWRGPMVTQALEQLLNDTNWGDLDYLIVDLPPGTGDTQLTLSQKIPVSGAVIVTTPQDIALLDARKGLKMFEKVEVPVLGVVENMSIHVCSECGHAEHIFGEGGGKRMADESDVDYLGALPLDLTICQQADEGRPTVVADPDSKNTELYKEISRKMAAKLASKACSSGGIKGLVEEPTIQVHKVEMGNFNLSGGSATFVLDIQNPNSFPIPLSGFDYGLRLNGIQVAQGVKQQRVTIGAKQSQKMEIPLHFSFTNMNMSIKSDKWIRRMSEQQGMIEPFESGQVRERDSQKIVSYGTSSYGYDVRCADEFKIFTNINSAVVDPKEFDEDSFGKSTYARCGIIVNVTPLEPEWEGHVTLEFSNTSPLPAKIYANEGVAQMLFFESDEICETSYKDRGGKYQGQKGVTLPKT
ncbi:Iron-sulfur cluster carrier protein [Nymphon striatum]|nr:Iron-sulfur cluster carrier protein [Nymphon striatum]